MNIYLPGRYLREVKRPHIPGVLRLLLTDDLVWWWLIGLTAHPPHLRFLTGISFLFASFWSVYEIGYRENDACALRLETDPVVSTAFTTFDHTAFEPKAWAIAAPLGAAGLLLLHSGAARWCSWAILLAVLRGLYFAYNRLDKSTRVWLYLALQCLRSLALLAVLKPGLAGLAAGLTQAAARWIGYFLYRSTAGSAWREIPARAVHFLLMSAALAALCLSGIPISQLPTTALILWAAFLARKELAAIARAAHWLHPPAKP